MVVRQKEEVNNGVALIGKRAGHSALGRAMKVTGQVVPAA
jgi:hypothetical protein